MSTRQYEHVKRQRAGARVTTVEVSAAAQWGLMRAKRLPEDFLRRSQQEQKQLLRRALEGFMPIAIERLVVETEAGG